MKWNKYTLKTRTEAEDLISSMMQDAGIEQKHIAFFDRIPFFVHKKAALSGEDDSDFDKIMAVRRFRLLTGKLTGEKKGGI